jgi:hypothetical protein
VIDLAKFLAKQGALPGKRCGVPEGPIPLSRGYPKLLFETGGDYIESNRNLNLARELLHLYSA